MSSKKVDEKKINFKELTKDDWKKRLTDDAFRVLREADTEAPYKGKYDDFFKDGIYLCNGCKTPLFDSKDKFKTHCGWPGYSKGIGGITEKVDLQYGMKRVEVLCSTCDGHLGHVFEDQPETEKNPKGLRYCINSVSLDFKGDEKKDDKKKL